MLTANLTLSLDDIGILLADSKAEAEAFAGRTRVNPQMKAMNAKRIALIAQIEETQTELVNEIVAKYAPAKPAAAPAVKKEKPAAAATS